MNAMVTLREILPIVILVAYSSLSVGAMIKLYHYGVRGALLFFAFLLPVAFTLISVATIKEVAKAKDLRGHKKFRFYMWCLKESPWLMPIFVAIIGKYLSGKNFLLNTKIDFKDVFYDNHFRIKMS
ncbi:hypothetical protein NSQ24_01550 [Brevibacillus sp. FSL L8-0520]|uniref:hypothetical protein n=1 Tax=Brevibacillus sp. FSL L8-0520 TaxID=2954689 RepID=UPI0030D1C65E